MKIGQYEIYFSEVESTTIEIKDQQIDCFASAQRKGLSLRVLQDDRLGFSYCTDLSDTSLDHVITNAVTSAKNTSPEEYHSFPDVSSEQLPTIEVFDNSISIIPKDEKINKVKGLEKAARSYDKRITKVRKAAYQEIKAKEYLINSNGLSLSHQGTFFSCYIELVAEEKGDSQMGWDFDFSRFYENLDVTKIGKSASSKALNLLGAKSIPSFRGPVIFDNSVSCQFLGVLAPSFLAESVQKNKSMLKGRKNDKVFSDCIDVIDDGIYPGGAATKPFDGEGVTRRTTSLIKNGVLENFLYDTYCARKDKTYSTGNSSRGSIKTPPRVGKTNLYIKKGKESFDDLTSEMDKGLLVNEVMGMHTADPISGDFSVGVNGFLLEKGKKQIPVKGIAISGNIMTLFSRVIGVGSDLRFFDSTGAPSLLIEEMDISGN
jgi:PmbA protein